MSDVESALWLEDKLSKVPERVEWSDKRLVREVERSSWAVEMPSWLSERAWCSDWRLARMAARLSWLEERLLWADTAASRPLPEQNVFLLGSDDILTSY